MYLPANIRIQKSSLKKISKNARPQPEGKKQCYSRAKFKQNTCIVTGILPTLDEPNYNEKKSTVYHRCSDIAVDHNQPRDQRIQILPS
jgi:hypothetical protein